MKRALDCACIIRQLGISSERFEAWKKIHIVQSEKSSMEHQSIQASISMENPMPSAIESPAGGNGRFASAHMPDR